MKRFLLLNLISLPLLLGAQVPDRSETDCQGISKSVYAVGLSGKPLLIASDGFDCSICQSHANYVRDFATDNAATIEVWGAMDYLYSSATPDCDAVNQWVNTYDWNSVFTFPDVSSYWFGSGAPTYYVIHPTTHEIEYQGSNYTAAFEAATSLVIVAATDEQSNPIAKMEVFASMENVTLTLESSTPGVATIEILNIVGQNVAKVNKTITTGSNTFHLPFSSNSGIYILKVAQKGHISARKFVVSK